MLGEALPELGILALITRIASLSPLKEFSRPGELGALVGAVEYPPVEDCDEKELP